MHRKAPISGGNESAVPMHHLSCRGPVNARLNYRPLSVRGEGEGGDKRVYKRRLSGRCNRSTRWIRRRRYSRGGAPPRPSDYGTSAERNYPNALTSLVLIVLFGPDRIITPCEHSSFARVFSSRVSLPLLLVDELGSRRLVLRID